MPKESINDTSKITPDVGEISGIPIQNLWLLMYFASALYTDKVNEFSEIESIPDEIPDLVAKILCQQVEERIRQNLSNNYVCTNSVLYRIRGSIDFLKTERGQLLQRGKIACRYNELTCDTIRNQYVRDALMEISKIVTKRKLSQKCTYLANALKRMGVVGDRPNQMTIPNERFSRNDKNDRTMVEAAILAFNLALLTEFTGSKFLPKPSREEKWVRKLFEKGVAGFYRVRLSGKGWKVKRGNEIEWPKEKKSSKIDEILPKMETDIKLDHIESSQRIIIDTKFTSLLRKPHFRDKDKDGRLHSQHIFQLYAYLRSQESIEEDLSNHAMGILLYPSIKIDYFETVTIQQHEIRFVTVDLSQSADVICSRLLHILKPISETDVRIDEN